MTRARLLRFLLAALPALLLWLLLAATGDDPVLSAGLAHATIAAAAILATAALAVIWLGSLALFLISGPSGNPATGFQRMAVFGLLSFAASFLTLRYFGFAIGTILTTSALVTAAIGFAMQPTLSSVIAGLALNTDRELHIGDVVLQDGRPIYITALGWRAAVGRRDDGTVVVLPNAKLSDNVLEILPRRQPLRCELLFPMPAGATPQAVCLLAEDVACRLPQVDLARAIEARPDTLGNDGAVSQFRLRLWLLPPYDRTALQGLFVEHFWYACRRHGLVRDESAGQLKAAEAAAALLGAPAAAAALAREGVLLAFAPGEALVMPPALAGARFLLLQGMAVERLPGENAIDGDLTHAPRSLALTRLTAALAQSIGPYAEYAVEQAAASPSYADLCRTLAVEIDDDAERERFLARAGLRKGRRYQAGAFLTAARDAAGLLTCGRLEADGETMVFAVPPGLLPQPA